MNIWDLFNFKKKSQDVKLNAEYNNINKQKDNDSLLNNSVKISSPFADMEFKWLEYH